MKQEVVSRTCNTCHQLKLNSSFSRLPRGSGGKHPTCRTCLSIRWKLRSIATRTLAIKAAVYPGALFYSSRLHQPVGVKYINQDTQTAVMAILDDVIDNLPVCRKDPRKPVKVSVLYKAVVSHLAKQLKNDE